MSKEMISVIVPCYNQAQFLSDALQSVFNQTYPYWECIIVNDGSTDNTESVASVWLLKDNRFKYFYQDNKGLSSARNTGLDSAVGDYIQFLDSDDVLLPMKFDKSLRAIAMENTSIVISNFAMFENDSNQTTLPFCELKSDYFSYKNILFNWDVLFSIPIHCGFFQKTYFENFRFPLQLKAKEDWILWLSIFKENPKASYIEDTLVLYRLHSGSMTQDPKVMQDNFCNALLYIKVNSNEEDFDKLLASTIARLNRTIDGLNNQIIQEKLNFRKVKDSNTYKVGYKIRDFLNSTKLLGIAKVILKYVK